MCILRLGFVLWFINLGLSSVCWWDKRDQDEANIIPIILQQKLRKIMF